MISDLELTHLLHLSSNLCFEHKFQLFIRLVKHRYVRNSLIESETVNWAGKGLKLQCGAHLFVLIFNNCNTVSYIVEESCPA